MGNGRTGIALPRSTMAGINTCHHCPRIRTFRSNKSVRTRWDRSRVTPALTQLFHPFYIFQRAPKGAPDQALTLAMPSLTALSIPVRSWQFRYSKNWSAARATVTS